ncbi:MAG: formate dehydrogenase subunit alpha [Candidatus Tectomicrobia bacterium]|nr:formate dehydrogenase subunit alpha [Candidatus Tectomicrobia bacterium]
MQTVPMTIDGAQVAARPGQTILEVLRERGQYVPTLCYDERLEAYGACRVCLVRLEGAKNPVASCTTPVAPNMVISTQDPTVKKAVRNIVELVLSDYPPEALARADGRNELKRVADYVGVRESRYAGARHSYAPDDSHPYIKVNLNECIVCGRCVRICDELQGTFALTYSGRGFETKIAAGFDEPFQTSDCVSCGACVSTCPTNALTEEAFRDSPRIDRTVTTTCSYCGVGCSLDVQVRDERVIAIEPAMDGPANRGHTCVKGRFAHQFAHSPDRLTDPLIKRHGRFETATWEEAIALIASHWKRIKAEHGPDAIAVISSSRCTNEENFLMQKFTRAALGTHNIDNCSRVCHSPSAYGLNASLGLSGGTNSFVDIDRSDCILVTGANPTEAHPVVGARIKQAVFRGAALIVLDPRAIELRRWADVFVQLKPGTNVAVFNGLAHVIVNEGLADEEFLEQRVEGFEHFLGHIQKFTPEYVERVSGVPAETLRKAARLYATRGAAGIFYGLGITEHSHGSDGVRALTNLAILTGNLGKPGGGVNPLRGQNNVQGASDMGALPSTLTMYQKVADEEVMQRYERAWGVSMKRQPGHMIPDMFNAAIAGTLKSMYIMAEDVAQTDPNTLHVIKALEGLEFLVVQDIFLNETAKYAHVVLPGSSFLEKSGTFTNAERRIQMVRRVIEPVGNAKADGDIIMLLAEAMGYPMRYADAAAVMEEVASLSPDLAGVSLARLERKGLQWPVLTPTAPDTEILYEQHFRTPSGKANLAIADFNPPEEEPDEEYPYLLVTGRQLYHYNSATMTRRTGNLELQAFDGIEIHPRDARLLEIEAGDLLEIESRRGSVRAPAVVSRRVAPGEVFMSFHFPEVRTNILTSQHADGVTKCPEYKVSAVRLRKVARTAASTA